MQLLHSTKCCCCANLRLGGLIIGYLVIIGSIFRLFDPKAANIIGGVIGIIAYAAWLYGIFEKKTDFMLPAVVLSCITLIVLIVSFVAHLILSIAVRQSVIDELKKSGEFEGTVDIESAFWTVVAELLAKIAIFTAISWHFTSVMYSLRKHMQSEAGRPNAMYGA